MTLFPLLAGGSVGEIAADADRNRQVLRHERWHRAVARCRGHVARADTELEMLRDEATRAGDTALESLCLSTRASLLRQAGRHDRALVSDARALAAIGLPGPARAADGRWAFAARMDALVGLAADNLGRFAFGASERLLRRARSLMAAAAPTRATGSALCGRCSGANGSAPNSTCTAGSPQRHGSTRRRAWTCWPSCPHSAIPGTG